MSLKKKLKQSKSLIIASLSGVIVATSLYALFFSDSLIYANDSEPQAGEIAQLNSTYEPSAVQQLPSAQLVVLEDEISRALNLLEFDSQGSLLENSIRDQELNAQLDQSYDDLEGIAVSADGEIYATTSFSRTGSGKRRPNREKLLRLVFDEEGVLLKQSAYLDFFDALKKAKIFKTLNASREGKSIKLKDINIEGLSFDAEKQHLLFGFKKPLFDDLSIIVQLDNPIQVLDGSEPPVFSEQVHLLDLQGGGIRSLSYNQKLQGFLIANEVDFGGGPKQSQLWFWGGDEEQPPIALVLPDIVTMENIEAISAVSFEGKQRILLMSDDGSRRNQQPAHYKLIDYDEIQQQINR